MLNDDFHKLFAIFDSFAWADEAAKFLKLWDQSRPEVKLKTVSLVYETEDGEIKVRSHGPRNILKGAEIGLILGMLAGRMTRFGMLRGTIAGTIAGAVIGSFSWQSPDLSPDELENLRTDLAGGKAGLVIQLNREQVGEVSEEIRKLEGRVRNYELAGESARISSATTLAGTPSAYAS